MAGFDVVIASGAQSLVFEDERCNPSRARPHRYLRVLGGTPSIEAQALIGGNLVADVDLEGALFQWSWAHWPGAPTVAKSLPTITQNVPGFSAIAVVLDTPFLDPAFHGPWALMCRRRGSGAVMVPFVVEVPT